MPSNSPGVGVIERIGSDIFSGNRPRWGFTHHVLDDFQVESRGSFQVESRGSISKQPNMVSKSLELYITIVFLENP